jgi:hypothetical protein
MMNDTDTDYAKKYFDFLKDLDSDPEFCYSYITRMTPDHPSYSKCIKVISKDAKWAYEYASRNQKRWRHGEKTISQDPKYAYYYAKNIINGRWKLGEKAIGTDAYSSLEYAKEVLGTRFEMGEQAIANAGDPVYAFEYAKQVVRGRWELGEKSISRSKKLMVKYAKEILMGPLPEEMHNRMIAASIAA